MARVTLENVTKVFGEVVAIKDVNIDIADGEFLVLLGPSGCGKTTALRVVAGLEKPTTGNVYIGGILVNDVHPKDRDVAMVFQSYALYPHMNVYTNMAFPLQMRKHPKREIDERVRRAAELLEISELLKRRPKELSGGQRQRVALGRAIVRNPKVFLMDEPLSNLDAKLRVQTRIELKNLQKRIGTTTIYVTHDQAEAMTLADRVAIMKEGEVQQVDPPTQVYASPANRFVAGFIGSPAMNFIEGTLVTRKARLMLDAGEFIVPIDTSLAEAIGRLEGYEGKTVTYGIRSEDVAVGSSPFDGGVEVSVFGTELMGSEQFVHARVGKSLVVARAPMTFRVSIGDRAWINLTSSNAHVFDAKTGRALV